MQILPYIQIACIMILATLVVSLISSYFRFMNHNHVCERSRWFLIASFLVFIAHFILQMVFEFRLHSQNVGVLVNVLFYAPGTFLLAISVFSLMFRAQNMKRFWILGISWIIVILGLSAFSVYRAGSLEVGPMLYVIDGVFALGLVYLNVVVISRYYRVKQLVPEFLSSLDSRVLSTIQTGYFTFVLVTCAVPIVILDTRLLAFYAVLFFLSLIYYVTCFESFTYHLHYQIKKDLEMSASGLQLQADNTKNAIENAYEETINNLVDAEKDKRLEVLSVITGKVEAWVRTDEFTALDLRREDALKGMGISSSALDLYLKSKEPGCSYRQWISKLRIEKVKQLLVKHRNYSIESISSECGFSNGSALSRAFKQQMGMSPTDWLEKQA